MFFLAVLYWLTGAVCAGASGLTMAVTPSGPTCGYANGTIAADAAGGTAPYTYSLNGGAAQTVPIFYGLAPGEAIVRVTDAVGVTVSDTVFLQNTYAQPSFLNLFSYTSSCNVPDGTMTLRGQGGVPPYQFSFDNIHYSTDSLYTHFPAGAFTVFERDGDGCTVDSVVSITNDCNFAFGYTTIDPDCAGSDGAITIHPSYTQGSPPYSFSMDDGPFQTDSVFSGLIAGRHTAVMKDQAGVINTFGFSLYSTCMSVTAGARTPCEGEVDSVVVLAFMGKPPYAYSLDGITFQLSDVFGGVAPGNYTVTVKDAAGVTQTTSLTAPAISDTLSVTAGLPVSICAGTSVPLSAASNGDRFSWTPEAGLSNAQVLQPLASPDTTTEYVLTVVRGSCVRSDSVLVDVHPGPIIQTSGDTTICSGASVVVSGRAMGAGPFHYAWTPATGLSDPDMATPVAQPTTTTAYVLTVTGALGCSDTAALLVQVTPQVVLFAGDDTNLLLGQTITLGTVGTSVARYAWSPATALSDPSAAAPVAQPTKDITYTVDAETANGCPGSASITIHVFSRSDIFVPSAFTPNGDGHNDLFKAIPVGIKSFGNLTVYDRWGRIVFRGSGPDQGWDGTLAGAPQEAGAYVWTASGIDLSGNLVLRRGTVVLIR
jgi:gliding motility-associated-like protein